MQKEMVMMWSVEVLASSMVIIILQYIIVSNQQVTYDVLLVSYVHNQKKVYIVNGYVENQMR